MLYPECGCRAFGFCLPPMSPLSACCGQTSRQTRENKTARIAVRAVRYMRCILHSFNTIIVKNNPVYTSAMVRTGIVLCASKPAVTLRGNGTPANERVRVTKDSRSAWCRVAVRRIPCSMLG